MARVSPFVAWCCGTAVSATIAWFGIAGAVSSAERNAQAIAVPERSDQVAALPSPAVSTAARALSPATTAPRERPRAAGTATSVRPATTTAAPSPAPVTSSSSTPPAPSSATSKAYSPQTKLYTVRGGSAVLTLDPDEVVLVSATPGPGYTARAVRHRPRDRGPFSLEITFSGTDGTYEIVAYWDGRSAWVRTS